MLHLAMASAIMLAAGGASASGVVWFYRLVEPRTPTLIYGVDESDDTPLILRCGLRKGVARLETDVDAPPPSPRAKSWPGVIKLKSGSVAAAVKAKVSANEESGGDWAEGDVPLGAPILDAFRRSGRLTVVNGGAQQAFDAKSAAELSAIGSFFQACAARPGPKA